MSLEAIRALLLADPGVAALVGPRVYPNALPLNATMPAVTLQEISGNQDVNQDGPSDPSETRIQIDCWARDMAVAAAVREAIKVKLNGFAGLAAGMPLHGVFLAGKRTSYELDTKLHGASMDFMVHAAEAAA